MPTFAWQGMDAAGQRARGRLVAPSEAAALRELESRGLTPIEVRERSAASEGGGGFGLRPRRSVLEFTRGMAALLPAGMPLSRALAVAAGSTPPQARTVLNRIRDRVERGDELAVALEGEPRLFSPLYVGMVRAGEKSGALEGAFERLARHLETEDELRSKLVSLSIYPILLAGVGFISVLILLLFVMPRFAELLASSGAELPGVTAAVLSVTAFLEARWPLLAAGAGVAVAGFLAARTTPGGRRLGAAVLLALPLIGGWRREVLAAQFARMTGELVAGGAPLLLALKDAEGCLDDPLAREAVARIRVRVREGSTLNRAVAEHGLFPSELVQLLTLGEESGRLSTFLLKGAELLERRTTRSVERMVALVEPLVIVLFGGVIAIVALSLLQAIYGVNAGGL
jgi:type II secretory pathway component PulF